MCNEPLVLIFDCGTQSTRAFLFNKKGEEVCSSKVLTQPFFSKRIGYAEKNTEDYWKAIVEASRLLKEAAQEKWHNIVAMSITTIRGTYACLNKNLEPVRPTITWLDQRLAKERQRFSLLHKFCFRVAGMKMVALKQRRMSPATWLKENEPENWKKIYKFTMISAYLNYKLCGRLVDSIASQASRLPFNYRKKRWMNKSELTYTVYNVEKEKLCDIAEPGTTLGYVTKEASVLTGIPEGLPIITTGSDKACETLGVGCLSQDIASISFGTTATVQVMSPKYFEPQSFMPAYNAIVPNHFNPEIQVFRGYWMVTWFKEQFAENEVRQAHELGVTPESILDMSLRSVPAGSDGLMLQPYWAPGLKIPEAKGSIIGFNDCHTRAHVYKAIIEGIGYELFKGLKGLEKRGHMKIDKLSVSGGGSQSDAVCQVTADLFGIPVYRVQTYETSGLGAAIMTFASINEFDSIEEAVNSMVHFKDEFVPEMKNHKVYMELFYKVYNKLYTHLQPLYNDLYDIVNKE